MERVPAAVDGMCVFQVPQLQTLSNCKGNRHWGRAQTSKSSCFTKGPRLLFTCRGSYICQNSSCPNIKDFGFNRTDFTNSNDDIICSMCSNSACYISCEARLFVEKDLESKINTIKHYGVHTCPVRIDDRPDTDEITNMITSFPKITREGIVRQKVLAKVQSDGFTSAVEEAKKYTDTKYIDNIKTKAKTASRPFGHSFNALKRLKESWDKQDRFLVYSIDDGSVSNIPYVIKSCKRKVKIMHDMDKDGGHALATEAVHLDVVHSRCKGWKTYTLSYYDVRLNSMVKLCTMDTSTESKETCTIFLQLINQMLTDYLLEEGLSSDKSYCFNPCHLKDDEAGGNKIAMKNVLGENFVELRTSSCEFHIDRAVKRHQKFVRESDRTMYARLCYDMKNAPTKEIYESKSNTLKTLITTQDEKSQRSLNCSLSFWDKCKCRWALSHRAATHKIPRSSLAESAHASMKAAGEKNLSLVDAAYADITDSARLEASFQNRELGERSRGGGPTGDDLLIRDEIRQIARTELYTTNDPLREQNRGMYDESRSHRPDKVAKMTLPVIKQKRLRSLESNCFKKALAQSKESHIYTKAVNLVSREGEVVISIEQRKKRYSITLSSEVFCTCTTSQQAERKICSHIVWVYTNVLGLNEADVIVAQVSLDSKKLSVIMSSCPICIPEDLTNCCERNSGRAIHPQVQKHPKFNDYQEWFIDRKGNTAVCRCSGCLRKGAITTGDIHFYVSGLLYISTKDMVVDTKLRFCPRMSCVTNMKGTFHNILDFKADMKLICPSKIRLSDEEQENLLREGFSVSFK